MGRRCGGDVHRPRSHRGPAHGDAGARHHRDHRHGYRGADQDRDPPGRHGGGPGDRAEIHPGGEAHREGDETQGLLREPVRFPPVISTIHTAFRPDAITVGVGLGGVATELTTRVTEMDGPVFVSARRAVETGKSKKLEVVVVSGSDHVDAVLNTIYGFIGGVQSRWKLKQWERVNLYRKHRSLEKVAREAGVTKQAISLDLRFTLWDRVLAAEAQLPEIVAFLLGGTPGSPGKPPV